MRWWTGRQVGVGLLEARWRKLSRESGQCRRYAPGGSKRWRLCGREYQSPGGRQYPSVEDGSLAYSVVGWDEVESGKCTHGGSVCDDLFNVLFGVCLFSRVGTMLCNLVVTRNDQGEGLRVGDVPVELGHLIKIISGKL
jgi:hypothetical protein